MSDDLFVTVWFTDEHRQRWKLPVDQTAEDALEELRQVIVAGQWFRPPESNKVYSPYAIVAVEVAEAMTETEPPSVARRLGEVVGDALAHEQE
jgi:hypothetical protein